jgi:hypothetical protein
MMVWLSPLIVLGLSPVQKIETKPVRNLLPLFTDRLRNDDEIDTCLSETTKQ